MQVLAEMVDQESTQKDSSPIALPWAILGCSLPTGPDLSCSLREWFGGQEVTVARYGGLGARVVIKWSGLWLSEGLGNTEGRRGGGATQGVMSIPADLWGTCLSVCAFFFCLRILFISRSDPNTDH
jgi:hypothetical protein